MPELTFGRVQTLWGQTGATFSFVIPTGPRWAESFAAHVRRSANMIEGLTACGTRTGETPSGR